MIAVIIFYGLMLVFLLMTCRNGSFSKFHIAVKTLTSTGFLMLVLLGVWQTKATDYFLMIFPGLLFYFVGDILLAFRGKLEKKRLLIGGMVAFAVGHVFWLFVFTSYAPFRFYDFLIPVFFQGCIWLLFELPGIASKKMRVPTLVYVYLIALLFVKTIESLKYLADDSRIGFLVVGFCLIAISDVLLIFVYFWKDKKVWVHVLNLVFYYVGTGFLGGSMYIN